MNVNLDRKDDSMLQPTISALNITGLSLRVENTSGREGGCLACGEPKDLISVTIARVRIRDEEPVEIVHDFCREHAEILLGGFFASVDLSDLECDGICLFDFEATEAE